MITEGMTYAAGGATLVGLAVLGFRSYLARNAARDKAEASVDQRAADLIQTATKPFQDVITRLDLIVGEERKAKAEAEEKRDSAVQGLVAFMDRSQKEHREEMARQQDKHENSLRRVHDRVDKCESERAEERATITMVVNRLEALETRERETLRQLPSPTQPTLVVQAPAPATIPSSAGPHTP